MYVSVLLGAANYPLVAGTFAHWSEIPWRWRIPAMVVCGAIVLYSVQGGSRAGIYGILIVSSWMAVAGVLAKRSRLKPYAIAATAAGALIAFLLYSSFIVTNRRLRTESDYAEFLLSNREQPVDSTHYAFEVFPKVFEPALLSGYFYFGHAYDGLARCLAKPFNGVGYGAGHSAVVMRNLIKITGNESLARVNCFDRLAMEDGYSRSLWVTIYPWIAADTTFPGSLVALFIMAYVLAQAWTDVVRGRNLWAAAVAAWIFYTIASTSVIFPPGDIGALISYWGSLVFWLRSRWRPSATRGGVA